MATYIALLNWTDQGIKDVKRSPDRLDAAKQAFTEDEYRRIIAAMP